MDVGARQQVVQGGGAPRQRRRGRPPAQSGDDTRAAVLAAAQRLFGAGGYRGVSMDAVAAECGLSARAVYYYFPSKRELFDAVAVDVFARFGAVVVDRVFSRPGFRDRMDGYVDAYRHLHVSDPYLLPFVGMVLVDGLGEPAAAPEGPNPGLVDAGAALRGVMASLVDDALAGGELQPGIDREGTLLLLEAIGMGMALASIGNGDSFPAMLDVLERFNQGSLYSDPGAGVRSAAVGSETSTDSKVTDPPRRGSA